MVFLYHFFDLEVLWGQACAAQVCFLVAGAAPQPFDPASRWCLPGADHRRQPRTYASIPALHRALLLEWARLAGESFSSKSNSTDKPVQPFAVAQMLSVWQAPVCIHALLLPAQLRQAAGTSKSVSWFAIAADQLALTQILRPKMCCRPPRVCWPGSRASAVQARAGSSTGRAGPRVTGITLLPGSDRQPGGARQAAPRAAGHALAGRNTARQAQRARLGACFGCHLLQHSLHAQDLYAFRLPAANSKGTMCLQRLSRFK